MALPHGATPPQPERKEPRLPDPRLRDLSLRDWRAILTRGARGALADNVTDIAATLSYYAFLAIPAVLLVAVGVFAQTAGPETIQSMLDRLEGVVPAEALTLIDESLSRVIENRSSGIALIAVGFVLALWTASSAMNALMRGLNRVYGRDETRSFVRQRLTALGMLACLVVAFGLAFAFLVLGPHLSGWLGEALGIESFFGWLWWTLEWPILLVGLLGIFAAVFYLGPNVAHPRWRFLTPGAVAAVVIWLVASGAFAFYTSSFGSYNKAWGSLAAVIIMLTWLWLSALALLLGAEINAEAERSRELRRGEAAEVEIQAPAKA
jgi:membrane protein